MNTVAINPINPNWMPFALSAVTAGASTTLIGTVRAYGRKVLVNVGVGTAAITDLTIKARVVGGGTAQILAAGATFTTLLDAAGLPVPVVYVAKGASLNPAHTTAAGEATQLLVFAQALEYEFWCTSGGTAVVTLTGAIIVP